MRLRNDARNLHAPTRQVDHKQDVVRYTDAQRRRDEVSRPHCVPAFDAGGIKVLPYLMPKEKVTLTLDSATLAVMRKLVGNRSLSAEVQRAVAERVAKLKHLAAVDGWLREMDEQHGPVPTESLDWAAKQVDDWVSQTKRRKAG